MPSAFTALINIWNAGIFLEEGRFIPATEVRSGAGLQVEGGAAPGPSTQAAIAAAASQQRPVKLTISRRDARGNVARYHIIDSVSMLKGDKSQWDRIVAVFTLGQEWQFKDWHWPRRGADGKTIISDEISPVDIFQRCEWGRERSKRKRGGREEREEVG